MGIQSGHLTADCSRLAATYYPASPTRPEACDLGAVEVDMAELAELRRLRDGFNAVLIKTRDDERRRIGRDIHDSTMQLLVGVNLAVGQLKRAGLSGEGPRVVADIEFMLAEAQRELRTIAFLAHPPELDRMGMIEAMDRLVSGFGRRTGLQTSFDCVGQGGDLTRHAQMSIYRIVQEALANVHRHARATALSVRLVARRDLLHVRVADNGCGIAIGSQAGVGLMGMRSRLAELGGRLTVHNLQPGAAIVASVRV
jgi:two-component system NarL family sensor kinase